jgi:rhodanese-related sulfurtransferase
LPLAARCSGRERRAPRATGIRLDFVRENIFLILIAFVSGAMLIWPLVRRGAGGPWIDTLGATQLINRADALVIDVRSPAEYDKGHILGARNLPLGELESRIAEIEKHKAKPVIVHCENGNRATGALPVLRKHGFTQAFNLTGGYGAWQQAGLPVEK